MLSYWLQLYDKQGNSFLLFQASFYLTASPLGPAFPLSPGMPISPWERRREVTGHKCLTSTLVTCQRGCDPAIRTPQPPKQTPSDTYRNTWLSRGSRLARLPWITLVWKEWDWSWGGSFKDKVCFCFVLILTTSPLDPFPPAFPCRPFFRIERKWVCRTNDLNIL